MKVSERVALAQSEDASPEVMFDLVADSSAKVRRSLAARTDLPAELLMVLAQDRDWQVRRVVAAHGNAVDALLIRLIEDPVFHVHWDAAQNPSGSADFRRVALSSPNKDVRLAIAQCAWIEEDAALALCGDGSWQVRRQLALVTRHRSAIDRLLRDPDPRVRGDLTANAALTYEDLRALARDPRVEVRACVAGSPYVPLGLLLELVSDKSSHVRFWLTSQLSQPDLQRALLDDPDDLVRSTAASSLQTALRREIENK